MKNKILLLLLVFNCSGIFAQNPGLDWVGALIGDSNVLVRESQLDAQGNSIIAGVFNGTADFDFSVADYLLSTGNSGYMFFLAKYDAQKNLVWANSFGGNGDKDINSLEIAENGNIHVSGYFTNQMNYPFGGSTTLNCVGAYNGFILKTNTLGNLLFLKQIICTNSIGMYTIAIHSDQSVLIGGTFYGTIDLDPGANSANFSSASSNIFILKLSAVGEFLWTKIIEGDQTTHRQIADLKLDQTGAIFACGSFKGEADFDPGPGQYLVTASVSASSAFVLKLGNNGSLAWVKTYGGSDNVKGTSIIIHQGNIFIGGGFMGTIDFDPEIGTLYLDAAGSNDVYILKLNANGNLDWVKQFGGQANDFITDMVIDANGNLIAVGGFGGTADFDPNAGVQELTPSGSYDGFVFKINALGEYQWAIQVGGMGQDYAQGINIDAQNNLYVIGYFEFECDFDPSPSTHLEQGGGGFSSFLWKLNQNQLGLEEKMELRNVKLSPNPSQGELNIKWEENTSFHTFTITDINGKVLDSQQLVSTQMELTLRYSLPAGLYFISLERNQSPHKSEQKWIIH